MFFLTILILFLIIIYVLISTRKKMYKYKTKQDYFYDFKKSKKYDLKELINLQDYEKNQTLIHKIKIKSTFLSKIFPPYVRIYSNQKEEKTFFEHGAHGIS